MNLLPEERAGHGLQAVFTSIFPFSDFRETCSLDFVKYTIGDWQCKCESLKGLEYLRMTCSNCGSKIMTDHPHEETVTCTDCGHHQQEPGDPLRHLRRSGRAAVQVLDLRVRRAGHDLRRAAQGDVPALRLRQGSGDRHPDDARRQGGGGLLRRNPADDRLRHLRHQRHRAGDRQSAPSEPGRLLHHAAASATISPRSSPTAAPGWSSSTTRRRSSRSASTASASSTARCSSAPSASRPTRRSCASSTRRSVWRRGRGRFTGSPSRPRCMRARAAAAPPESRRPRQGCKIFAGIVLADEGDRAARGRGVDRAPR